MAEILFYATNLIGGCDPWSDTGGGRNSVAGRDNGTNHVAEKGAGSSLLASGEKHKETTPSAR